MEHKFELNAWLRYLRRQYPLMWAVASTLGHIVRAVVRTWVPISLGYAVFAGVLEPILAEDHRLLPHWLPILAAVVVMTVMIWQDRRWEYSVLLARRGQESPGVLHDVGLMLSSIIYWTTTVTSVLCMLNMTTYFVDMFARWMPDAPTAQHVLYAGVFPSLVLVLFETAAFLASARIFYRAVPADEAPIEPEFPSPYRLVINALVWGAVLVLLPVSGWVLVTTGMVLVLLFMNYWRQAVVIIPCAAAAVVLLRAWRVWRIRSRCVKQLKQEMDAACIRYEFAPHPIRSAFWGGEDVSLRIFLGDAVKLVRFVPFYARRGTLIVTPDGNIGQLHRISLGRPVRVERYGAMDTVKYAEFDPSGKSAKKNAMTEWITKRETVFEDARYPDAEKIYLISPTPKFWVAGDLKATANLDNGSRAYGYTLWTTSAFCRHLRMRQEDILRGR